MNRVDQNKLLNLSVWDLVLNGPLIGQPAVRGLVTSGTTTQTPGDLHQHRPRLDAAGRTDGRSAGHLRTASVSGRQR